MTEANESLILYIALYDLTSGHKNVLPFKKSDRFIPVPCSSNNNSWAVCVDMKGNVGYVPHTYVEKVAISPEELLCCIDSALEKLHADSPTAMSKLTRDVIKDLTFQRTKLSAAVKSKRIKNEITDETGEPAPMINHVSTSNSINNLDNPATLPLSESSLSFPESPMRLNMTDPENGEQSNLVSKETANSGTQTDRVDLYNVPKWLVPALVENIRHKTQISHENSKVAVKVVLDTFMESVPLLDFLWEQMRKELKSEISEVSEEAAVSSEDQRKLMDLFKQLWYCKNDEQQRSWPVHEDEDHIAGLLTSLNDILIDGNPRFTREIVRRDEYEMVNLLVTYYQMEPRRSLRVKMLHVLLTLCELDLTVLAHLLSSVLTMELARDIQDNFDDNEKVLYSCCLLTVIFSTGEHPPNSTYDFFNKKFLHFLFEKLEEVVKEGDEDVGQNILGIILAFNLHFENVEDNIVMETLKEVQSAQVLTEKLVFLLNREEDPCRILNHELETKNSVSKFMVDLFSFPALIDLFYLNDVKVLLDIIVRQLTDLLSGEKKRLEYLHLIQNLLKNSNYAEHMHQIESLRKCFRFILAQEFPEDAEVEIVLNIKIEFQSWFEEV